MYSVIDIADAILSKAKVRGIALTPLQLMKLVYISHGWFLALDGRDLFRNRIEAWKYGPVIPDLYHSTKQYGRKEIPFSLINDEVSIDDDIKQFLEQMVDKYGELSGYNLSSMTHQSGTPWDQVYEEGFMGKEISDELIKSHYLELYDDYNNNQNNYTATN